MELTVEQIADLVNTTLTNLGRAKVTDLTSDLQEYTAMSQIMRENRVTFDDGKSISFNFVTGDNGQAKNTGLFAVDDVNVNDVETTGSVPWKHNTTNYAYDRREMEMCSGASQIVNLIKIRRMAGMISFAKLYEDNWWGGAPLTGDTSTPFGIKYWVVKNAVAGFTGTTASGTLANAAGCCGLTDTAYPRWKNYAAPYTAISKEDLVRAWRKAATMTLFKPPIDKDMPASYNTGDKYAYYVNYNVYGPLEEMLETQNDNLGNDIASKDGEPVFHRRPITYVPYLDDDSDDPVYGLNWGEFKIVFLQGEYFREDPPEKAPNQHTVVRVNVDCTGNTVLHNRRRCFVLSKGTTNN